MFKSKNIKSYDMTVSGYVKQNFSNIKFLNFWTSENFAVIYLKFKQRSQTLGSFVKKMQGIANSEDPDQSAPLGEV